MDEHRTTIRTTKLELLRSGPQHNQLLSPLTPYIALGGSAAPQTVHLPYEQRQLLTRLARLRYSDGTTDIVAEQRESELRELGEAIGDVLGEVPSLQTTLDSAMRDGVPLVHVRLAISALELGMVPFEAAIAPKNFPCAGFPLLLRTPTVITREVRRNQPLKVNWVRPPRILFAYATPPGQLEVPAFEHLKALRRAIDPYVVINDDPNKRLEGKQGVRAQLTVLPEASLKAIADACSQDTYTHVHILAHGQRYEEAGQRRYGVALRWNDDDATPDVVSGARLASALRGACMDGSRNEPPTLVSLATCDSGAVDSVLAPGGSIAHELHEDGIPWVIASQFPLWMHSSTIAVEALYGGILSGADPRCALHKLRRRLHTEVPQTHDWASIVAYATVPWNFEEQVETFFDKQIRRRLEVCFARLDELTQQPNTTESDTQPLAETIRAEHKAWINRTTPRKAQAPAAHADALGMSGASEKRIAIACAMLADQARQQNRSSDCTYWEKQARDAYTASRKAYREAVETDLTNHWAITQFLAIAATPLLASDKDAASKLRNDFAPWWSAARQIARWKLKSGLQGQDRAWAYGTLAELELLASVYQDASPNPDAVTRACQEILDSVSPDDFAIESTRRQFKRYTSIWKHERWNDLAEAAIAALKTDD